MNNSKLRQMHRCDHGFTLVELLVVIFIIGVIVALLLPSVRMSREAARRTQCSNNIKNVCLALQNYHDAHRQFPMAMGGTGVGATPNDGNANRLSGLVALLPFIEQDTLWQQIAAPGEIDGVAYPAMGPAPWVTAYTPWKQQLSLFQCPSAPRGVSAFGRTHYAFCIGDIARQIHQPAQLRGAFGCGLVSRLEEISDGAGHTIALGEIGTMSERSVAGQYAIDQPRTLLDNPSLCFATAHKAKYADGVKLGEFGRGGRWADGAAGYGLVNTILPPNSPSCAVEGSEAVDGVYSVGSFHGGGAMVAMADGSVHFINEDIDTGDPTRATLTTKQLENGPVPSPYGVWGALGTATGGEPAKGF